jgi:RNA polymerase sigma-70 factor (ECF subfamily)
MNKNQAFLQEFMIHRHRLFHFILSLVNDFHCSEDILQEVSITAMNRFESFRPGTSFWAWLREIARLKMLEHRRKWSKTGLNLDPEQIKQFSVIFDKSSVDWEKEQEALKHCMTQLSKNNRKLVQLRYNENKTMATIGETVRRTPLAVQIALSRIRKTLSICIQRQLKRAT